MLFPFSAWRLGVSFLTRNATSRWIIAFLVLVDLGVILAPAHQILPRLNFFPELPRTDSRILSWYILVYTTLQLGIAPPVVFFRSLRTAWRGKKPPLATWICLFGLVAWAIFMFVVTMGVITIWAR